MIEQNPPKRRNGDRRQGERRVATDEPWPHAERRVDGERRKSQRRVRIT